VERYIQPDLWSIPTNLSPAITGTIIALAGSAAVHSSGTATLTVTAADVAHAVENAQVTQTIIAYIPHHADSALDVVLKASGVLGIGTNVAWAWHHLIQVAYFTAPLVTDWAQHITKIAEQMMQYVPPTLT
jgi:hypothetical protein